MGVFLLSKVRPSRAKASLILNVGKINMQKSLKEKAIKIRGKSYVLVSDRVLYFNDTYPNGSIQTELITNPHSKNIIVKAKVIPDAGKPDRFYTGYSQTVVGQGPINETAALENAETSAVGRALALMGIGVVESIASADEMEKALQARRMSEKGPEQPSPF